MGRRLCLEDLPIQVVAGAGAVLAVLLALGWRHRIVSIALIAVWCILSVLMPETVLTTGESLPWHTIFVLGLLILHALTPAAPFGSIDARGRVNPAGDWHMPAGIVIAGWLMLSAFYLFQSWNLYQSGAWGMGEAFWPAHWNATVETTRLISWTVLGTWLAFAPLALTRTTRPLGWSLALISSSMILPLFGQFLFAATLLLLHLYAFSPTWLPTRKTTKPETIFYDGDCGLCHRWVRFVLAEDPAGQAFDLAPLQSDHFIQAVKPDIRETLPDSIIVLKSDGNVLSKSVAIFYILNKLGGLWRVISMLGSVIPRPLRDWAYDRIAAIRKKIFAAPKEACPLMPPDLRGRFRM